MHGPYATQRPLPLGVKSTTTVDNLDDGRAGEDVVVVGQGGGGGEDDVGLAGNGAGNVGGDHVAGGDVGLDRDVLESVQEVEVVGRVGGEGAGRLEGEVVAGDVGVGGDARRGEGEAREGLYRQGGVGRGAGDDEGRREGVDLVEVEGGVERRREGREGECVPEEGRVSCLDGEDRAGGGRHSDTLEHRGEGDKGLDVGVWEVVDTLRDGRGTGCEQGGGEEVDVGRLVLGDLLQILVEGRIVPGGGKLSLGKVGQTLSVKGVLEVLQSEGVVEDDGINVGRLPLLDSGGRDGGDAGNDGEQCTSLHYVIRE
ncbi:protein of unknown function [Taphrina deformans PYCC 5710]|uniref:Uncharacterized protein n=1 Tax=Taphrina deformans (strain PYCC 5710 / ATCC 11124 / CBS 356.35 / IMI 108563 / JCM 9778 / NBRC 8474) TaxID=1097556 RepID=R4XPT1_TAPDE|nr:protein of unknown function [Taphrina deformans PYCC 5710]|eukprot:CCG85186.1 protein of unknown function [Taphrina deformans PYCC 5710]